MTINKEVYKTASYVERALWAEFKAALPRTAGFDSMPAGTGTAHRGILLGELRERKKGALCLATVQPGA